MEAGDCFTPVNVMNVAVGTIDILLLEPKVGNSYSGKVKGEFCLVVTIRTYQ